jgi:hypothetical protein
MKKVDLLNFSGGISPATTSLQVTPRNKRKDTSIFSSSKNIEVRELQENCLISDQKTRIWKFNYDKNKKIKVKNSIKVAEAIVDS